MEYTAVYKNSSGDFIKVQISSYINRTNMSNDGEAVAIMKYLTSPRTELHNEASIGETELDATFAAINKLNDAHQGYQLQEPYPDNI